VTTMETSLHWTSDTREAAKKEGYGLEVDDHRSYVHISEKTMDRLDEVYVETFRGDDVDAIRLADCFCLGADMGGGKRTQFKRYLGAVRAILNKAAFEANRDLDTGGEGITPQGYGIIESCGRLDPLFLPLQCRICLPLATMSMIEDLKPCVLMASNVVREVRILARIYCVCWLT